VSQSRGTVPAPRARPMRTTAPHPRPMVMVAILAVVLAVAGCGGGGDRQPAIPEAQLLPSRPGPTLEPQVRARPWASSRWHGQAWGAIWREETRNPKDLEGRGIDAYKWAIRTCDAVRNGGQTAQAMLRRVRDQGGFTEQGARVIVTAALRALCPADSPLSP
jgi:hypothetical protein